MIGAIALAMVAALRGELARAVVLRRLVRLSAGVALFGMGLNVAMSGPPITLAWGALLIAFAGYFIRAAVRRTSM